MGVSTTDVSVGGPQAPTDLELIFLGGENFLVRMKAMSDERAGIETAIANLKIGSAAKAAYDDARQKQEQASRDRDEAAELLRSARAEADVLISAAKVDADNAKADAYNAERLRADADARLEALAKAEAEAKAARTEADAAKAAALVAEREFRNRKDTLNRRLQEIWKS